MLLGGRLRDFFALERSIVILLTALLILGMGEELWSSFAPKYLEALGASALVIGAYGTLQKVIDSPAENPVSVNPDALPCQTATAATHCLSHFEQHLRVELSLANRADGFIIACEFGRRRKLSLQPPGKGVEPENAAVQTREQSNQRIAPAYVGTLVG